MGNLFPQYIIHNQKDLSKKSNISTFNKRLSTSSISNNIESYHSAKEKVPNNSISDFRSFASVLKEELTERQSLMIAHKQIDNVSNKKNLEIDSDVLSAENEYSKSLKSINKASGIQSKSESALYKQIHEEKVFIDSQLSNDFINEKKIKSDKESINETSLFVLTNPLNSDSEIFMTKNSMEVSQNIYSLDSSEDLVLSKVQKTIGYVSNDVLSAGNNVNSREVRDPDYKMVHSENKKYGNYNDNEVHPSEIILISTSQNIKSNNKVKNENSYSSIQNESVKGQGVQGSLNTEYKQVRDIVLEPLTIRTTEQQTTIDNEKIIIPATINTNKTEVNVSKLYELISNTGQNKVYMSVDNIPEDIKNDGFDTTRIVNKDQNNIEITNLKPDNDLRMMFDDERINTIENNQILLAKGDINSLELNNKELHIITERPQVNYIDNNIQKQILGPPLQIESNNKVKDENNYFSVQDESVNSQDVQELEYKQARDIVLEPLSIITTKQQITIDNEKVIKPIIINTNKTEINVSKLYELVDNTSQSKFSKNTYISVDNIPEDIRNDGFATIRIVNKDQSNTEVTNLKTNNDLRMMFDDERTNEGINHRDQILLAKGDINVLELDNKELYTIAERPQVNYINNHVQKQISDSPLQAESKYYELSYNKVKNENNYSSIQGESANRQDIQGSLNVEYNQARDIVLEPLSIRITGQQVIVDNEKVIKEPIISTDRTEESINITKLYELINNTNQNKFSEESIEYERIVKNDIQMQTTKLDHVNSKGKEHLTVNDLYKNAHNEIFKDFNTQQQFVSPGEQRKELFDDNNAYLVNETFFTDEDLNIQAKQIKTESGKRYNKFLENFQIIARQSDTQMKTIESEIENTFDNEIMTEKIDDNPIQNTHEPATQNSEKNINMINANLIINDDFKEQTTTVKINELSSKLVEYIRNIKSDKMSTKSNTVFISIEPENLGKIKLKFLMHDNKFSAELYVSRPITKEIIESQISDIKRILLQDNILVSSFNVNLEDNNTGHSSNSYDLLQQNKTTQDSSFYKDREQSDNRQENDRWRYARYTNSKSLVDLII